MTTRSEAIQVTEALIPRADGALYRRSVLPAGPRRAHLAVLHGYGDHSGRYLPLMRWMAERGIACHALDFRGHGKSEGRRGFVTRWEEYLTDLDAFLQAEELRAETRDEAPLFVLGHSHGALVLAAAGIRNLEGVSGCIFTAPYFRSLMHVPAYKIIAARLVNPILPWLPIPNGLKAEWMSRDDSQLQETSHDPLVLHTATPRWYLTCHALQPEVLRQADRFTLPLLILAGDDDPLADPRAAHEFYDRAASADKTFRLYPEHRHELLHEIDRETIYGHILEWLEERLP